MPVRRALSPTVFRTATPRGGVAVGVGVGVALGLSGKLAPAGDTRDKMKTLAKRAWRPPLTTRCRSGIGDRRSHIRLGLRWIALRGSRRRGNLSCHLQSGDVESDEGFMSCTSGLFKPFAYIETPNQLTRKLFRRVNSQPLAYQARPGQPSVPRFVHAGIITQRLRA